MVLIDHVYCHAIYIHFYGLDTCHVDMYKINTGGISGRPRQLVDYVSLMNISVHEPSGALLS